MNLDKLKENARRHELREDWRKAIETYQRALRDLAEAGEPADPSLFNRIGDLELKAGEAGAALRAYEQAADTYAEQGFFNNAIALCGKVLRVSPSRTATYLRLAELNARKNVIGEARRNLTEYVERMTAAGQIAQAGEPLREFAERFVGSPDLRVTLTELLEQLQSRAKEGELDGLARALGRSPTEESGEGHGGEGAPGGGGQTGRGGGLVFLDTGVEIPGLIRHAVEFAPDSGTTRLEAEDDEADDALVGAGPPPDVAPLPFIEPTAIGLAEEGQAPREEALQGFEPTFPETGDVTIELMEPLVLGETPDAMEITGLEPLTEFEAPASGGIFGEPISLDPGAGLHEPMGIFDDLEDVPAGGTALEPLFDELEVEAPVEPARRHHAPTDEDALAVLMDEERWPEADALLDRLIRKEPDKIEWQQQRVELAYRTGDRGQLVDAYLGLAQVLERLGAAENAALVFSRVLEHDAGNPVAEAALFRLGLAPGQEAPAGSPAPDSPLEAPETPGQFIDLGELILDPEPDRDTRMRVEAPEPVGDEDKDFLETLAQFKLGLEANVEATDFQTHYDLGIAFKEMGLLDEAVAQFQKALRSPEGRLRSIEGLGQAFFEKGRHAIAEAVLSRAIDTLPGPDDEKIGLIYWRGRALEALGRRAEALLWYERALAVDITFLDLSERIQRLGTENPS